MKITPQAPSCFCFNKSTITFSFEYEWEVNSLDVRLLILKNGTKITSVVLRNCPYRTELSQLDSDKKVRKYIDKNLVVEYHFNPKEEEIVFEAVVCTEHTQQPLEEDSVDLSEFDESDYHIKKK